MKDRLCPWCIADGCAHEKYNVEFIDPIAVGNYGLWDKVPPKVVEEIAFRTPGFTSWQEGRWWTHCGDGAEFLGFAGKEESISLGSEFLQALRSDIDMKEDKEWQDYLNTLNKDKGPTAYIFRYKQCGKYGGYSDFH